MVCVPILRSPNGRHQYRTTIRATGMVDDHEYADDELMAASPISP